MKAVVFRGIGDIALEELPEPKLSGAASLPDRRAWNAESKPGLAGSAGQH